MLILRDLDEKEEREIRETHELQKEMHLFLTPVCYLNLEVKNQEGKIISKYKDRSKSWVRNFYNWQAVQQMACPTNSLGITYGEGSLTIANQLGSPRYDSQYLFAHKTSSLAGFQNGIIVGTGDDAESFESYDLSAEIEDGTGAGQLQRSIMSQPIPTYDGVTKEMTLELTRNFINNSGGSIEVKEVGLWALFLYFSVNSYSDILVSRDLLSPTVTVDNSYKLTVTYMIQITYPA